MSHIRSYGQNLPPIPVVMWWKTVAATTPFAYGIEVSFVAGEELNGTAFVKEMRMSARVTRHQPSLRMLYISRSLGARFSWEGGRNP
jgi:hypothetical protein